MQKGWFVYLQGQGHSKVSYDQNVTVSAVSSELLIFCNQTWFDGKSSQVGIGILHSRSSRREVSKCQ